jgi:hypothetical protein
MTKFAHADVLDGGPALIKSAATKMLLISAYTAGDSYAAVVAAKLAEVTMTSADYTHSSSGNNRVLTVASGKTALLTVAATGTDSHVAFTDGTSRVLWVTDDTTNGSGSIGATATFGGPTYTANQPT